MSCRTKLGLIAGAVVAVALGYTVAEAVVWCQGDELGGEKARDRSARASQKVYQAVSDAFQMLGFVEMIKFDTKAEREAVRLHSDTHTKLSEAKELFRQLASDKTFLAAADKVILGQPRDALAARLTKAGLSPSFLPLQETIAKAEKEGSKVIFERCEKEIDDTRVETEKFKDFLRDRGQPERVWSYIRVLSNLVIVGRGSAALFYPPK